MKKKAIISTVASVMLAGVMCVGFAACGSSAESVKGEEVTAEQWAAAFAAENFENVKIEMETSMKMEMGEMGSYKVSGDGEIIIADGKAYYKLNTDGEVPDEDGELENMEQYEEKTEGGIVVYTQKDGAWVKDADGSFAIAFRMVSAFTSLATQFDSYEYNADKKGYIAKSGEEGEFGQMIYKFKDGKLAAVWAEIDEEETEMGITMSVKASQSVLFTYGGQSVTLPTVA